MSVMDLSCLTTTVKNISGREMFFGFFPPHGKTLADDAELNRIADGRTVFQTRHTNAQGCIFSIQYLAQLLQFIFTRLLIACIDDDLRVIQRGKLQVQRQIDQKLRADDVLPGGKKKNPASAEVADKHRVVRFVVGFHCDPSAVINAGLPPFPASGGFCRFMAVWVRHGLHA